MIVLIDKEAKRKESSRKSAKKWRKEHPAERAAQAKRYQKKHAEQINAYQRKYYAKRAELTRTKIADNLTLVPTINGTPE